MKNKKFPLIAFLAGLALLLAGLVFLGTEPSAPTAAKDKERVENSGDAADAAPASSRVHAGGAQSGASSAVNPTVPAVAGSSPTTGPGVSVSGPGTMGAPVAKFSGASGQSRLARPSGSSRSTKGTPVYRTVPEILAGKDLSVPAQRSQAATEMAEAEAIRYRAVLARAEELGIPMRVEGPGHKVSILHDIRPEGPLYRTTMNANAAISSAANLVYPAPYSLNGSSVKVGVWDAGSVRNTHREFTTTRVVKRNSSAANDDHATHVAGTIGASGVTANAKGMAPSVAIDSWDWNSDYSEMTSSGAATATADASKIPISNHSYGYNATTADMGRYETEARDTDALLVNLPYYLPFWAAGNEQDFLTAKGGYQSITFNGLAKNLMTVG